MFVRRAQATLVAGLLLLTGAGEVLGACFCEHRGGQHPEAHGAAHVSPSAHTAEHGSEPDEGADPASQACRMLCALVCSANPNPTADVSERAPDLRSSALTSAPRPAEPTNLVRITARPHFLPFSQAPPTSA